MDTNFNLRLGYACINNKLRDDDIFTSRKPILATIKKKGIDDVKRLVLQNLDDVIKILIFNEANGFRFYRLTSELFPHMGNSKLEQDYTFDFAKEKLKSIGKFAKKYNHRITAHPGQYNQMASKSKSTLESTFVDLTKHADVFKYMNLKPSDGAVMIVHGGGVYCDKKTCTREEAKKITLDRWRDNFLKLPKYVQEYIVLENDEWSYGVNDLLPLCEELKIPLCFDFFHNSISNDKVKVTKQLIKRIFSTWFIRGLIPKMHLSEQNPEKKKGCHSETLDKIPHYILKLPQMYQTPVDLMLEVKDKETSVFKMYAKYFDYHRDDFGYVTYTIKNEFLLKEK